MNKINKPYYESQLKKEIYNNLFTAKDQNKIPAFSYNRVSTTEQALTGHSPQYQQEKALRYADSKNLYVVYNFTVSESARKEGRKVFNAMLDLATELDRDSSWTFYLLI